MSRREGEGTLTSTSAAPAATPDRPAPPLPPVLGRLLRGTFFQAIKTPLAIALAFISVPMVQRAIGESLNGAYLYAWGFGFLQFLLEFGMGSALQREVAGAWTRGDREGVDRSIACGMNFYAVMSLLQAAALLAIAYLFLPLTDFWGHPAESALIVKLLWLQVLTSPFYGLSAVVGAVLQAARRYDVIPRLDLAVVALRFVVLAVGLAAKVDFFVIVATQTALQIVLSLGPGLWVMVRDLGYRPHFAGATRAGFTALTGMSAYLFLIQLSVVLADKVDITILGSALTDPGPAITVYQNVSKPFLQIRQTGWTLTYLVMPAVASLAAARDERGLDRMKYDGPRLLTGLLMPVALLAGIYAGPFLDAWVGPKFVPYAPLLRLFLVATIPLLLSVQVQMAIGMGKIRVIALSAIVGALINLPISFLLTRRIGVAGVIWGTVLTTLFSNGLVPGLYVFKVLAIDARTFLVRSLLAPAAGGLALVVATSALRIVLDPSPVAGGGPARFLPFAAHLAVGSLAYGLGYFAAPAGRGDLALIGRKVRRQDAPA